MDPRVLACFDHSNYHFYEKSYHKGEVIINPVQKNEELLFILEGTIAVYAIKEDGRMSFVSMGNDFTMLGDIEFVIGGYPTYFVEAKEEVKAIGLNLNQEKEKLNHDLTFMHYVMNQLVEKITVSSSNQIIMPNLEERLLVYIDSHDGKLNHIEQAAFNLHCSKRQVQRVLRKLVEEGKIQKIKKGVYCK